MIATGLEVGSLGWHNWHFCQPGPACLLMDLGPWLAYDDLIWVAGDSLRVVSLLLQQVSPLTGLFACQSVSKGEA